MENVNKQQPIYISLTEFGYGSQELNPKTVRLHLTKKVGRNNRDKDLKNAYSLFSDVLVAVASLDLTNSKDPNVMVCT